MRRAVHSEWTKLRTIPPARWLLPGFVVIAVVSSTAVAAAVRRSSTSIGRDGVDVSLTGIVIGEAIVAMLAVLTISGEYSSGMIRTTLTAVPRRNVMLAAKAVIVGLVALPAAIVAVTGCLVVGRLILHDGGTAGGTTGLSLTEEATMRTAATTIVHVVLIALLSLGIATAARDSATSVGAVLGLIYLFPIVTAVVSDPDWQRRLQELGPLTADLGTMVGWAAAGLLAGAIALRVRDA